MASTDHGQTSLRFVTEPGMSLATGSAENQPMSATMGMGTYGGAMRDRSFAAGWNVTDRGAGNYLGSTMGVVRQYRKNQPPVGTVTSQYSPSANIWQKPVTDNTTTNAAGSGAHSPRPQWSSALVTPSRSNSAITLPSTDTTPPSFGGLTTASVASATSVTLGWSAGTDNVSIPSHLYYEAHWSTTPNDTFTARKVFQGVTSGVVDGLIPGQTYYFRVRCRDEAGNVNSSAGSEIALTPDMAPGFAGATGVAQNGFGTARVSWAAASDDHDVAAAITYRVHVATAAGQPFVAVHEVVGQTHFDVGGLSYGVPYYFKVRAYDTSNVGDTNTAEVSITMVDNPPTFAGVVSAAAASAYTATVSWAAGTDDVTAQAALVYHVHVSTAAGQPFTTAAVSAAGATSTTVTGLMPSTRYYVKVRARDGSNQLDSNTVEVSFATPDDATSHPQVGNWSPAAGAAISAGTAIGFDVTGVASLRRVVVAVTQSDTGVEEIVHDGDAFRGLFGAGSTRTAIAGGWHFSVARQGGWTGSPTFRVYAVDAAGREND